MRLRPAIAGASRSLPGAGTAARLLVVRDRAGHRWLQLAVLAAAAVVALIAAEALADYRLLLFSRVLAFVVAILGLNIVTGLSGQLSIGHNAFIGMGAYTSAILVADHDWPWLPTLVVSAVVGFAGGLVLAVPAMRVRGLYLALVTLAFGVLFPTLARRFSGLTGGANGKSVVVGWVTPSWFPFDVSNAGWRLLVLFVIAALAFGVASSLLNSPWGRALIAQRDNEMAATTCGVNLRQARVLALAVSAAFGAISGSMLTLVVPVVSPDGFGFALAVQLITGLVVGGMARLGGAVLGALLVVLLPHYSAGWSAHLPLVSGSDAAILSNAIYGVILIVVTFALPGGLATGIDKVFGRIIRVLPYDPATPRGAPVTTSTIDPGVPITPGEEQP